MWPNPTVVIPGQPAGLSPESITTIGSMDSGLALRAPRNDGDYAAPSRIGGWNDSAVSQGKKIQVSCDTSVMKVSTSGRPCGLA